MKIKLFGREIPLTKSGYPNLRYLSKNEKLVVKEYQKGKRNGGNGGKRP